MQKKDYESFQKRSEQQKIDLQNEMKKAQEELGQMKDQYENLKMDKTQIKA